MNGPRIGALALVVLTALLLDSVILAPLAVAGAGFEIVVLTAVAVGLEDGPEAGMRYGFAAGLVSDLVSGGLVGLGALVLLLVGFTAGRARPFLTLPLSLPAQALAGAAGVAAAVLLTAALTALVDPAVVTFAGTLQTGVIGAGLNGLAAPLVIRPVAAVCRRTGLAG